MQKDWSVNSQLHGRITTSAMVASAELAFFGNMESMARDKQLYNTSVSKMGSSIVPLRNRKAGSLAVQGLEPAPKYQPFPELDGFMHTRHTA